jgi:hypothetical protein
MNLDPDLTQRQIMEETQAETADASPGVDEETETEQQQQQQDQLSERDRQMLVLGAQRAQEYMEALKRQEQEQKRQAEAQRENVSEWEQKNRAKFEREFSDVLKKHPKNPERAMYWLHDRALKDSVGVAMEMLQDRVRPLIEERFAKQTVLSRPDLADVRDEIQELVDGHGVPFATVEKLIKQIKGSTVGKIHEAGKHNPHYRQWVEDPDARTSEKPRNLQKLEDSILDAMTKGDNKKMDAEIEKYLRQIEEKKR